MLDIVKASKQISISKTLSISVTDVDGYIRENVDMFFGSVLSSTATSTSVRLQDLGQSLVLTECEQG